jgi:hypothetical protein
VNYGDVFATNELRRSAKIAVWACADENDMVSVGLGGSGGHAKSTNPDLLILREPFFYFPKTS